jgi:hypothetical protein
MIAALVRTQWRLVSGIALTFALGAAVAGAAFAVSRSGFATGDSSDSTWREVPWPFPLDQWGRGRAFRCGAAGCGADVMLLLRAKAGFCNCTAGIRDDDELDRVSDVELFGSELPSKAPGQVIHASGLVGRGRHFFDTTTAGRGIFATAFHVKCDAVVATAIAGPDALNVVQPAVMEFLNRGAVLRAALTASKP